MLDKTKLNPFSAFLLLPFCFDHENNNYKKLCKKIPEKIIFNKPELSEKKPEKTIFNKPELKWEEIDYSVSKGREYNEYTYFYDYAKKILFNRDKSNFMKVFRLSQPGKKMLKEDTYVLEVTRWQEHNVDGLPLALRIHDILLHIYDLGVGILSFHLESDSHLPHSPESLKDFMLFLDLARRVYPPFVQNEFDFTAKQAGNTLFESVKKGLYPEKTKFYKKLENDTIEILVNEDFSAQFIKYSSGYLSPLITILLNREGLFSNREENKGENTIIYHPVIDDRMFVHSFFYIDKKKSTNRKFFSALDHFFSRDTHLPGYAQKPFLDILYRMIFIDGGSLTCQNDLMLGNILKKAVYTRWSNYGTYYGFSRFSSIVVVADKKGYNLVYPHFKTMYYRIACLLFFYRGTLLHFSQESAAISSLLAAAPPKKKELKKLEKLYAGFLGFRNRFWFREVTAQDQGIDMFTMWNGVMDNPALMKDVKEEIQELYNYTHYIHDKDENNRLKSITIFGAIVLPLTVVSGLLGMNLFSGPESITWEVIFTGISNFYESARVFFWLLGIFYIPLLFLVIGNFIKKRFKK